MDTFEDLASEVRKMALEKEELKSEIQNIKYDLLVEKYHLDTIKQDNQIYIKDNESNTILIESVNRHLQTTKLFAESLRKSTLMFNILKKFVEKSEPNHEKQNAKISQFEESYEKMLKSYEDNPTYRSILQQEVEEKNLNEKIMEKRNKLMRLETEKEY